MSALDAVEWEACLLEPVDNPQAERAVRKALGMVPPAMRYFLDSAWWADAAVSLGITHSPILHLPPNLTDLVPLVVSQESACRYCFSLTRGMLGVLGFSEARIRRIEEDLSGGDLGAGEQAALRFARQVARSTPMVTAADAAPLRQAGWHDAAVKELAAVAAVNVFYNRAATLPALPYEDADRMFDRPLFRILGPLLRPFMKTRRARSARSLSDAERQGPFAAFVNALDGLPLAPRLRSAIDACLRASSLGPRVTALVFAVVARGIGCPLSEAEAVAMLRADGVPAAEIEPALAHLAAPWLGVRERAAAALARDSIWPQPAALQRHARSVRPLFTRQEFVDLIGTAALANAVCRLAVAVDLTRGGR